MNRSEKVAKKISQLQEKQKLLISDEKRKQHEADVKLRLDLGTAVYKAIDGAQVVSFASHHDLQVFIDNYRRHGRRKKGSAISLATKGRDRLDDQDGDHVAPV